MARPNPLPSGLAPLSRRRFLQQTVSFSALAAMELGFAPAEGAAQASQTPGAAPPLDPGAAHLMIIGDWGTDRYPQQQIAVATAMKNWVDHRNVHPGALLLLGDNWYGDMGIGYNSSRWQNGFEQMYPASHFPGPAYAVLGNHDYEYKLGNKVDMQLGYAQHVGKSRWTMPARWYTFRYPEDDPIITFICLDSNLPGTKSDPFPWSFTMTKAHRDEQNAWFAGELAKPRTTPFLGVIAHHPLYTNGIHRDNHLLIKQWDGLCREHKVDFWVTGHDHDLQHLEFAGHPTSFVVSGAGGAELVDWTTPPEQRGPFGGRVLGFSDMELHKDGILLRHIDTDGTVLHSFRKAPGGHVDLFSSAA